MTENLKNLLLSRGLSSIIYSAWCWIRSVEQLFQQIILINDNDEGNNNDEQFSGSTYDRHNSKHFQCLSSSDPHKIMR